VCLMTVELNHESSTLLSEATQNQHRAIVSLKEELDAVDWYQQRADACTDDGLRAILLHNMNEEIEHAMMILEWLRRNNSAFASNVERYLNSSGPITLVEQAMTGKSGATSDSNVPSSLGVGSLKVSK